MDRMKMINEEFHKFVKDRSGKVDRDCCNFFATLFTDIGLNKMYRTALVQEMNETGKKKMKLNGINLELF